MRKLRSISKFITSETETQTIAIHIMPSVSKSKCNQTMKFVKLIEYNVRNIFVEKQHTKCGGEASTNTFYKKLKLSISLDQQSEVLKSLLLWYVQVKVYQNILKLMCCTLAFTLFKGKWDRD